MVQVFVFIWNSVLGIKKESVIGKTQEVTYLKVHFQASWFCMLSVISVKFGIVPWFHVFNPIICWRLIMLQYKDILMRSNSVYSFFFFLSILFFLVYSETWCDHSKQKWILGASHWEKLIVGTPHFWRICHLKKQRITSDGGFFRKKFWK